MPFWEIRGTNKTVQATADNWLTAVSSSLENLGLDKNAISRMVCDIQPDGVVSIRDPKTGVGLAVRQIAQAGAAGPSAGEAAAPVPQVTTASSISDEHLVTGTTPDDEPPADLVEQLFDREMEIEMAEELNAA
ncbi:MAG: hypothetical protein QGG40_17450, partial [Myxococcota bacterium]|nr:hypothetical protein [Myxococcota bacterium]